MKQIIRYNTFETNSSSAHSLILISKETFDKWRNGELMLDGNPWEYKTDKDFIPSTTNPNLYFNGSYEDYEREVISGAYDENRFWDEEDKFYELSKEGIDPRDFDEWDKNPYPEELDDGKIKIEVFGRDD